MTRVLNFRAFLMSIVLLFASMSWAVLNKSPIIVPATDEERLIQQATVRIIWEDPAGNRFAGCSGVVFSPSQILTAQHCLPPNTNLELNKVYVEVYDPNGPIDPVTHLRQTTKLLRVRNQMTRLGAQAGIGGPNDIQALQLAGELPMKFSIPMGYNGCDNDMYTAAGFGIVKLGNKFRPKPKKASAVTTADYREFTPDEHELIKKDDPENHDGFPGYGGSQEIKRTIKEWSADGSMLCLRPKNSFKICLGDSGGPVFCRSKGKIALVGIISALDAVGMNHTERALEKMQERRENNCPYSNTLFAVPLKDQMDTIEKWRSEGEPAPKTKSTRVQK